MRDGAVFIDRTGAAPSDSEIWDPVLIPSEVISEKIHGLSEAETPPSGIRRLEIVHPSATEPGLGLAPGIGVFLDVLRPGERVALPASNATEINFSIGGGGRTSIEDDSFRFDQHDVWVRPALRRAYHHNDTQELQARLTFSNAPLLEKLQVHFYPFGQGSSPREEAEQSNDSSILPPALRLLSVPHPVGRGTVNLMSYESLINPEIIEQPNLHWPWKVVKAELDHLTALGSDYEGRRLYLLYNPATGRTNGTTNNFFATVTIRPPKIADRPHRHVSAAINYFMSGSGDSLVGGHKYHWKAGDLMLTAPGWMVHRHASHDESVYELTIQDSPMHLALDSLLWQENLKRPPHLLGSHAGFFTNREEFAAATSPAD